MVRRRWRWLFGGLTLIDARRLRSAPMSAWVPANTGSSALIHCAELACTLPFPARAMASAGDPPGSGGGSSSTASGRSRPCLFDLRIDVAAGHQPVLRCADQRRHEVGMRSARTSTTSARGNVAMQLENGTFPARSTCLALRALSLRPSQPRPHPPTRPPFNPPIWVSPTKRRPLTSTELKQE